MDTVNVLTSSLVALSSGMKANWIYYSLHNKLDSRLLAAGRYSSASRSALGSSYISIIIPSRNNLYDFTILHPRYMNLCI
jgi:hypothetical protein